MDPYWVWFMVLVVASALFFAMEVFIPSAGILGTLSAMSLVGALIILFAMDVTYGLIGTGVAVLLVPAAVALAMKIFPYTPIGKRLILQTPPDFDQPVHYTSTGDDNYDDLAGVTGKVISTLRPVGMVQFGDRKVECLAERGPLEPGTTVKVVAVRGFEVKVREV